MKNITLMAVAMIICTAVSTIKSQTYTWMKGSSQQDQPPYYGIVGVSAPANNPGTRSDAVQWQDAAGNFWMFGGLGVDALGATAWLNDLWKYNPTNNQWTFMKGDSVASQTSVHGTLGIPSANNKPGARTQAATWTDTQGNLWLMGGFFVDQTFNTYWHNDLWKYNISSNQWTWVHGSTLANQNGIYGTINIPSSTNHPGARYGAATWIDAAGNFWLFGGNGFDISGSQPGALNDLWKYDQSSNQWTWVKGSNLIDQNAMYGTLNVPSSNAVPGGRYATQGVSDAAGNFWLFGGFGYDGATPTPGELNDLWQYDAINNEWTWKNGNNLIDQSGNYGIIGVQSSSNKPGARDSHTMWADANGNLWLFGGFGLDNNASSSDILNDLWKYSTIAGQWTWMKGSSSQLGSGTYGTQGVPGSFNTPAARRSSNGWMDASGSLWLFAGAGTSTFGYGQYNDLWKLTICNPSQLTIASSHSVVCSGNSATITVAGAITYTWNNSQTTASIIISLTTTSVYSVSATNASGCNSSSTFTQVVLPKPTIAVGATNSLSCPGQIVNLVAVGASTYSWSTNQAGSNINVSPSITTQYSVTGTDQNGCSSSFTHTQNVEAPLILTITSSKETICANQKVILTVTGAATYSWHVAGNAISNTVQVQPSVETTYTASGFSANLCRSTYTFTQLVSKCTDINELNSSNQLHLYPNPNNGEFFIGGLPGTQDLRFVLADGLGRIIHEQFIDSNNFKLKVAASIGIYYYRVYQANELQYFGKLLIK